MVVVVGGAGDGLTTLSDVWLLDVTNRQWKQVCYCYQVCLCCFFCSEGKLWELCMRSEGYGSFPVCVCVSTVPHL